MPCSPHRKLPSAAELALFTQSLGNQLHLRSGGSYLRLIGPHSREARQLGGLGACPPRKFWDFKLSEMVSGALLSDKSARQCLTKNNSNKMRTGGRYGQSNLLFASSSARAPHNRVASKIHGWSPCAAYYLVQYKRL